MTSALLPVNNTTPWEKAVADAIDEWAVLSAPITRFRSAKMVNPDPSLIPFLIAEYGLEELTPFVPDTYQLLNHGIDWQRLRGTIAAVQKGLGFLGLDAEIEEALGKRLFWNAFQLHFASLPPVDFPLLERVENITRISTPIRSKLRRGTFEYDVRTMVTDNGRLDQRRLDSDSGVRVREGGTLWSFGRTTELEHHFTVARQIELGFYIEPDWLEQGTTWLSLNIPWLQADFPWSLDASTQRRVAMLSWFYDRAYYVRIESADGVIGYRKARYAIGARPQLNGVYDFGGQSMIDGALPEYFIVEAMTDFRDADGVMATKVQLIADPVLAPGVPPGRLWLAPSEISGGTMVAEEPVALPLRNTVREKIRFRLHVDVLPPPPTP